MKYYSSTSQKLEERTVSFTLSQINTALMGQAAPESSDLGPGGVPNTNGSDGDNAADIEEAFDDQDFSLLSTTGLFSLTPPIEGGEGSFGWGGLAGQNSGKGSGVLPTAGGDGGDEGNGGGVTLTLKGDSVGTAGDPYSNSLGFNLYLDASGGGSGFAYNEESEPANSGGKGGDGYPPGVDDNGNSYIGLNGAEGGLGGNGGDGGYAVADLTAFTANVETASSAQAYQFGAKYGTTINVIATGDDGALGGDGGAGGGEEGSGGAGGDGGIGGDASALLTDSNITSTPSLYIAVGAEAGAGGDGGNGGPGGIEADANPPAYGRTGDGGIGGPSGAANATLSNNTISSYAVSVAVAAAGWAGGVGGIGPDGSLPGALGAQSTELITFTNNTINVGEGSAPASIPNSLILNLYDSDTGFNSFDDFQSDETLGGRFGSYVPLDGASGGNLVFSGNDIVGDGSSTLRLEVLGGGVNINAISGSLSIGGSAPNTVTGFTTFDLDANDTIEIKPGDTVNLNSDPDTVVITAGEVGGTIVDATAGDFVLDFVGFGDLTLEQLQQDTTTNGGNTVISLDGGTVTLEGYVGGLSGADTQGLACFVRGTRIRLARGEVMIEDIVVGDLAFTASGALRPVRWLGRRRLNASRHPAPSQIWPVLVEADAFAPGAPQRDLWLSPGHSVVFDSALIPISALVNGVTIRQVAQQTVEYWHLELDAHDIVLSEGLPSESFLDVGNRAAFENRDAFLELHPNFSPRDAFDTCLPLCLKGELVDRARLRLAARARALRGDCRIDALDELRVMADGRLIDPTSRDEDRALFELSLDARTIVLVSRVFVPARDVFGADDTRALGICLRSLKLDGETVELGSDELRSGWHQFEPSGPRRWTDGAARLPAGVRRVEIEFGGRGHYRRADPAHREEADRVLG
jgi:hypothetical protein